MACPTAANPPTGQSFTEMAAKEFGDPLKYRILSKSIVKIGGWFDTTIRELGEMLYQNHHDYRFDSTKFAQAFDFRPTPYAERI